MILYSIVPIDIVFGNNDANKEEKLIEMSYKGEKVQVSPLENNRYVIKRLISTSPKAYLDPGLQPGVIIEGRF